jgi:transcriptional regulator with XRE-family HTH domain
MEAPRAFRQIRQEVRQAAEQRGIPALPHGGDLLHALRMRRGWSLDEAAQRVQVTGGTLRRWEKLEVWPSIEQLHRLCYALGAHEEEVVALTVGRFSQKPSPQKTSVEALQERLEHLHTLEDERYPLFELEYLQLKADAWPLAMRSVAGKQMLIAVSASHAQGLSFRERLTEAGTVADQTLDLMADRLKPERSWIYPVMVSARASVSRGEHPAPKRGLERLRSWFSAMTPWPELQAWMLADMAKYLSQSGEPEAALPLAEQACREAEASGIGGEMTLRCWDKAFLLLQASRPAEALAIVEERTRLEDDRLGDRIDISLLRAEVYLSLGNLSAAHDWLQRALTNIDTHHLEDKRPRAEKVAARM